ncbi:MAG: MobC family plasmid mobilization relaxosome protein [Oscillospiraceae bacterium]|nr:MobC family plasmid mobilization relaxosome protein [Oscillospiraceae bacterium]
MPKKQGTKEKKVYYSPSEWERICKFAAMLNMRTGTYIKEISLNALIKKYDLSSADKLSYSINRYGNNLNQIARIANATGSVLKPDIESLQADVAKIERDVERYLAQLEYEKL